MNILWTVLTNRMVFIVRTYDVGIKHDCLLAGVGRGIRFSFRSREIPALEPAHKMLFHATAIDFLHLCAGEHWPGIESEPNAAFQQHFPR